MNEAGTLEDSAAPVVASFFVFHRWRIGTPASVLGIVEENSTDTHPRREGQQGGSDSRYGKYLLISKALYFAFNKGRNDTSLRAKVYNLRIWVPEVQSKEKLV